MAKKVSKEESDNEIEVEDDIIEDDENEYNDEEDNNDDEEEVDDINDEYIDNNEEVNKEEIDIDFDDDDIIKHNFNNDNEEYLKGTDRISRKLMTKYEMVRILGERTKQLRMGAKPLIKNYKEIDYDRIAEEELINNMIPYKIKRPLPNGKYEIWDLNELDKDHLLYLLE